jgi:hypothetical protein
MRTRTFSFSFGTIRLTDNTHAIIWLDVNILLFHLVLSGWMIAFPVTIAVIIWQYNNTDVITWLDDNVIIWIRRMKAN